MPIQLQLSHPLYFILFSGNSSVSFGDTVIYFFLSIYQKDHQSSSFVLDFSYSFVCVCVRILVCICSKGNKSKLVDCYLHSRCTCMYFMFLCDDLLQIPVPHRNKTWSQNILLLHWQASYAKELTAAYHISSKFIGCY